MTVLNQGTWRRRDAGHRRWDRRLLATAEPGNGPCAPIKPGLFLEEDYFSACSRSANRSPRSSMPTLNRTRPSSMPRRPGLGWQAGMGHRGRVGNQRFHSSKTLRQAEEPRPRQQPQCSFLAPRTRTLIMPPNWLICRAARSCPGWEGSPG